MLKSYIKRFNDKLTMIHKPQENGVMMAAISRVRPEDPFWEKLPKDECKLLQEFYKRADKIMLLETIREAIQAGKPTPSKRTMITARSRKMEIVAHLQKRQAKRLRPLI